MDQDTPGVQPPVTPDPGVAPGQDAAVPPAPNVDPAPADPGAAPVPEAPAQDVPQDVPADPVTPPATDSFPAPTQEGQDQSGGDIPPAAASL